MQVKPKTTTGNDQYCIIEKSSKRKKGYGNIYELRNKNDVPFVEKGAR